MNPMNVMKAKGLLTQFTTNHPKLPAFFKAASSQIGEGSIIEISVTTAEGKNLCTNMKVRPEDRVEESFKVKINDRRNARYGRKHKRSNDCGT